MPAHYILPSKSIVTLTDGMKIGIGDTIARTPRETSGTRDITGGLPRVAELFEDRQPKDKAEIDDKTGAEVGTWGILSSYTQNTPAANFPPMNYRQYKSMLVLDDIVKGVFQKDSDSEQYPFFPKPVQECAPQPIE